MPQVFPEKSQACGEQCLADGGWWEKRMQGVSITWEMSTSSPMFHPPSIPLSPPLRSHWMLHTGSGFTNAQEEIILAFHSHYSQWLHFEYTWIKIIFVSSGSNGSVATDWPRSHQLWKIGDIKFINLQSFILYLKNKTTTTTNKPLTISPANTQYYVNTHWPGQGKLPLFFVNLA